MATEHKNSNNGPRSRESRSASGTQNINQIPQHQVSFDKNAFDQLLQSHGVRVVHYRAIPDPRGMASKGDSHDALGIRGSSDMFIYEEAGTAQVLFQTNSTQATLADEGVINFSTAYMTLPSAYENGDPVIVANWDRFYLKDIEVRVIDRQFVEASSTGVDRLHYPVTCIESLVDSDGVKYQQDVDFELTCDGAVKWLTQKRPGFDPKLGHGKVYAVRYRYTPFFIVSHIIHEIRIAQITDPATFDRSVERVPYQVQVVRERVFRDTNKDPNKPIVDERFQYAPPVGGMLGTK